MEEQPAQNNVATLTKDHSHDVKAIWAKEDFSPPINMCNNKRGTKSLKGKWTTVSACFWCSTEVPLDRHMLVCTGKTLLCTGKIKGAVPCTSKNLVFCSISVTVPSFVLSLWAKSMQLIHPKVTPLSHDHLTGVIGPTKDGPSSHKVRLAGQL